MWMSHLGLSTQQLLISVLGPVLSLWIDGCPLQKGASLAKAESSVHL